ncbi:LOW QUALITY PROTEIN: opsin-5-like [Acridotheres tristis]
MGNVSKTSVFTSTLLERQDLIFGTLYSVFGTMSLAGSSLLLLAHQKRFLLKPAEFFMLSRISDLGTTVTLFPSATSSSFAHRWLFDQSLCTLCAFCGLLFGQGSLAVLSTVCSYPAYPEPCCVPGVASQVPALPFVLSAVPAKSSMLHNPLVCLLLEPSFQQFLCKDRVLLQALHTLLCCSHPANPKQPNELHVL